MSCHRRYCLRANADTIAVAVAAIVERRHRRELVYGVSWRQKYVVPSLLLCLWANADTVTVAVAAIVEHAFTQKSTKQ